MKDDLRDNLTHTQTLTFDAGGPKSILEMVYDIAEIASTKYDYNMRGDDFKFTMAMVHYSFEALMEVTHGSAFTLTQERVTRGLQSILGANRYRRLQELVDSIDETAMEDGARNSFTQSVFLARLMLIRDEMESSIMAEKSQDGRERRRQEHQAAYRDLVAGLSPSRVNLSSGLNFAAQRVLGEMRELLNEVER